MPREISKAMRPLETIERHAPATLHRAAHRPEIANPAQIAQPDSPLKDGSQGSQPPDGADRIDANNRRETTLARRPGALGPMQLHTRERVDSKDALKMSDERNMQEDHLKIGPSKTAGPTQETIHAQVDPHGEQRQTPADLGNPFQANAVNDPHQHRNGARAQDAIPRTHAPRNVAQHPRSRPANPSPRDGMHGTDLSRKSKLPSNGIGAENISAAQKPTDRSNPRPFSIRR